MDEPSSTTILGGVTFASIRRFFPPVAPVTEGRPGLGPPLHLSRISVATVPESADSEVVGAIFRLVFGVLYSLCAGDAGDLGPGNGAKSTFFSPLSTWECSGDGCSGE